MESKIVWNDIKKVKPKLGIDILIVVNPQQEKKSIVRVAECFCGYGELRFETYDGYIWTKHNIKAWAEVPEIPDFGEVEV
jgi:hypothetical protein